MKILMTGATGRIGNELGRRLFEQGHELFVVTRSQKKAQLYLEFPAHIIECDLVNEMIDPHQIKDIQVIFHLMGETVDGRWTEKKKNLILESRQKSSQNLLKSRFDAVQMIFSASAQGIYQNANHEWVTEQSTQGSDFLAQVCQQWEQPFIDFQERNQNIRCVQFRIGLVLDPHSGVLKKMIPLFQRGFGGHLGSGDHYMSWIALTDLVDLMIWTMNHSQVQGPLNCGAPIPVTNAEWTQLLCQQLGVIQSLPVPKLALRLVLGEMADVVLNSVRMSVDRLISTGFQFKFENLKAYLESELLDYKNQHSVKLVYQYVNAPIEKVFPFFAEAQNLESITPKILQFKINKMSTDHIQLNTKFDYSLKIHGVPVKWKTLISDWQPGIQFVDEQLSGPYHKWHHTHQFVKMGVGTLLIDRVIYKLPFGYLGNFVAGAFVQSDVDQIFKYRREIMAEVKF